MRGLRLAGFLLGLVGVGVLAGVHPEGGWWGVAGTLAVVVASVSYAVGSLWGQRLIASTSGLVLSASSMLGGLVVLLPFGLAQLPSAVPGWKEIGSVIALAVIGTALAQILLYRVLRTDGAARVSLVTYLLPVTALFYGVTAARRAADLGGARRDGADPRRSRARLRRGALRRGASPSRRLRRERRLAAGRAARRRLPARADGRTRTSTSTWPSSARATARGCSRRSSARRPSPRSTAAS